MNSRLFVGNGLDPRRHSPLRLTDTLRARLARLYQLFLGVFEAYQQARHRLLQRERLDEKARRQVKINALDQTYLHIDDRFFRAAGVLNRQFAVRRAQNEELTECIYRSKAPASQENFTRRMVIRTS